MPACSPRVRALRPRAYCPRSAHRRLFLETAHATKLALVWPGRRLSVAAPLVTQDLGLTPADFSALCSRASSSWYALFNFIGGWASDKLGGKRVFTLAMGVWSAFCAMTAVVSGLLVPCSSCGSSSPSARGPLSSTINKGLVNNWFPHREAASAVGYANCGTPLGGAIAGPLVGFMAVAFG